MPKYLNLNNPLFKFFSSKIFLLLFILIILLSGFGLGFIYSQKQKTKDTAKDPYISFTLEIYDKIIDNYWDKITEDQLISLYKLGLEKITNQTQNLSTLNKKGLEKLIQKNLNPLDNLKKKELVTTLSDIVLANLNPYGRSRLYSKKEETALSQNVQNINPNVSQYDILGVNKEASQEEIKQTFEKKAQELTPEVDKSPEAKEKLQQISKAYEVLSDKDNKQLYDSSGVEPTISWKIYDPDIFYMHLIKFSPTTLDELQRVMAKTDGKNLSAIIIDLRDNIGGAIDGLPYFLGPFIGMDQYAYQFYHKGDKTDFKTKTGWLASLVKFKKVIVLINENTQSSAEVMAATLKKYNVGVLVGTTSKGWGTVEKVFPLENQIDPKETFSVFMVHSLTLREDGQPIEGKGVEPVINIKDANWENQLNAYFNYDKLTNIVSNIVNNKSI